MGGTVAGPAIAGIPYPGSEAITLPPTCAHLREVTAGKVPPFLRFHSDTRCHIYLRSVPAFYDSAIDDSNRADE
jgi:hypothetical protein